MQLQELAGFVRLQRQPLHAQLRQAPGGAQPRQSQRRVPAAGQRELRIARELLEQGGDDAPALPAAHQMAVVEDQQERGCVGYG